MTQRIECLSVVEPQTSPSRSDDIRISVCTHSFVPTIQSLSNREYCGQFARAQASKTRLEFEAKAQAEIRKRGSKFRRDFHQHHHAQHLIPFYDELKSNEISINYCIVCLSDSWCRSSKPSSSRIHPYKPRTRTCIMASPSMQRSNDENRTPAKHTPKQSTAHITNRAALGDVSPNVKAATPAFLRKPMAGSPLKRSFTAAMEGGGGLMYLKKRKLSEDEVLSQVDGVQEQGPGTGGVKAVHARTISLIDDEDEVCCHSLRD